MLPDFVYYLAGKDRIDIGIVPPFTKVNFYSSRRILLNTITKSGRFEEGMQFGNTTLAWVLGSQARKKNIPAHFYPQFLMFISLLIIYVMMNNFQEIWRLLKEQVENFGFDRHSLR